MEAASLALELATELGVKTGPGTQLVLGPASNEKNVLAGDTNSLSLHTPVNGSRLGFLARTHSAEVDAVLDKAVSAFPVWRDTPPPQRGELIRLFAIELRAHKKSLGRLVTLETGKILSEGQGEVQEMIDICDFAVGLSRRLYGRTIASERPDHKMTETWHPLGVVAIITAFNFPVAVWAWNATIALVCGDPIVWKPSEKTPLTALACQALLERAASQHGETPPGISQVVIGEHETANQLADDPRVTLVSATGSVAMGRNIAGRVAGRLGRCLLELGGNNAMIVAPSACLDLAVPAIVFGAAGTAGQRCTTLRRLLVHEDIYKALLSRLLHTFKNLPIGDPYKKDVLMGPLLDEEAFHRMSQALEEARNQGGKVHGGKRREVPAGIFEEDLKTHGYYVTPALVEMHEQTPLVAQETFAPILYVLKYRCFTEAIRLQNAVPQGLSSAIFTNDLCEAEVFLSARGSDCGIANVNTAPSGAEIGGAFGGEKDTGGGREAGSDAWKTYMRRSTSTVNYSSRLPLAQDVSFPLLSPETQQIPKTPTKTNKSPQILRRRRSSKRTGPATKSKDTGSD